MDKNYPANLRYTKDHEWARAEGDVATVGITWHAQDALGDIVFCELPEVGAEVVAGKPFGVVESVKAVSDLFAPVTGTVAERNDKVVSAPETLNADTYGDGWMIKVRMKQKGELDQLLSQKDYLSFLSTEH
jgi:glycine cleavage system H protein